MSKVKRGSASVFPLDKNYLVANKGVEGVLVF